MPYLPYAVGTEVCNIFWADVDCLTVTAEGMPGYLANGEAKIFLPKTNSYFENKATEFIN